MKKILILASTILFSVSLVAEASARGGKRGGGERAEREAPTCEAMAEHLAGADDKLAAVIAKITEKRGELSDEQLERIEERHEARTEKLAEKVAECEAEEG